jgi:heme/copper-type cytochrome/quinol oxidase subunit 2
MADLSKQQCAMNSPIEAIFTIVGAILGIILFFKVWGMTNNVKRIREIMEEGKEEKSNS